MWGKIISEIAIDDLKINDPEAYKKLNLSNITHQIIDRPKILQKFPEELMYNHSGFLTPSTNKN